MAQFSRETDLPSRTIRRNRNLFPKAGAWKMFGLRVLFLLPVIGLIGAIVFSFVPVNPNLKSLARSELLMQVVYALLFIIALSLFLSTVYPTLVALAKAVAALGSAMEQLGNMDPSMLEALQSSGIDVSALQGLNLDTIRFLLP